MSDMFTREMLKTFKAYEWEASNEEIARSVGLNYRLIRRFDTNTSPYKPTHWLMKLAEELPMLDINQYPDTSYSKLRMKLSGYVGVNSGKIVVTNGADEALDIISKAFIDPGTTVLISTPTYPFYRITAELMSANVVPVLRKEDFSDDIDSIINKINDKTRLIFLCSPNNPTGNTIERKEILRLLNATQTTIVIDEAYQEYGGESFVDLIDDFKNLLVIRTLSKAFGLAGIRVGYIVGCQRTVDSLNKVRPPNSLSVVSLRLAEIALDDIGWVREKIKLIIHERDRCIKKISGIEGVKVYPSAANFFLIELLNTSRDEVQKALVQKGLVTRVLQGHPVLDKCLRFAVSLPENNDNFIEALREELEH
jgi:histidinol-phosphate aminotransferase